MTLAVETYCNMNGKKNIIPNLNNITKTNFIVGTSTIEINK